MNIANGDAWLSREVPKIPDARSPFAKAAYAGDVAYSHGSLLRTVQDVFALRPYMRDAASVTALSDLFTHYP